VWRLLWVVFVMDLPFHLFSDDMFLTSQAVDRFFISCVPLLAILGLHLHRQRTPFLGVMIRSVPRPVAGSGLQGPIALDRTQLVPVGATVGPLRAVCLCGVRVELDSEATAEAFDKGLEARNGGRNKRPTELNLTEHDDGYQGQSRVGRVPVYSDVVEVDDRQGCDPGMVSADNGFQYHGFFTHTRRNAKASTT